MEWNKAFVDDDDNFVKRRKFREISNISNNLTEGFGGIKGYTYQYADDNIISNYTLFEAISMVNTQAAAVEIDNRTLSSMLGCMEPKMERFRKKMCEFEQSLLDMKAGGVEYIVTNVIKVIPKTMMINMPQVEEKVPMEDIYCNTSWADVTKEEEPGKFCSYTPRDDTTPDDKSVHMTDEKVMQGMDDHVSRVKNNSGIFSSMRNFSEKESKILEFLFGKGGNNHAREEVARYSDIVLSHGEFQCLKPTFPLLHKVIDISAAYLYEENSKSWFFPTSFGNQACSNYDPLNSHALVSSTIHLCGLRRFHRRLKRCSKIFIPLHDEIDEHWFLLVMKLDRKYAEMWDSLPDSSTRRREKARAAMLLLQTIFEHDMIKCDDVYYHFPSFRVTAPENNPTNDSKFDSAIYTIRHMQRYGEKWYEGFNSCDQRNILALEIVNHPKNELLKSISAATIGVKRHNDHGPSLFTTAKPLTSRTDSAIGFDKLINLSNNNMSPTGRKYRSHRKRRDACDA